MKRIGNIFALTFFAMTIAAIAQVPAASAGKPEKLSKHELRSLVKNAATPEQHMRLARYYEAKAQQYLAESNEHGKMAEQFRNNPMTNNDKRRFGTVDHGEYYAQLFKQRAIKMQSLADMQRLMAAGAENSGPRNHGHVVALKSTARLLS